LSLEQSSTDEVAQKEAQLLALIPAGSQPGNVSLIRLLKWPESEYWNIRNRLIDRGVLEKGRGRGGSVRRVVDDQPLSGATLTMSEEIVSPDIAALPPSVRLHESALYEPVAEVLKGDWAQDNRYDQWAVEITGLQGRRDTGGKWTRPDITMASMTTYPWVPGRHFDITTFEVKPFDAIDISAVYEALSHLRSATRAYVLLEVKQEQEEGLDLTLSQITSEAKRYGIGVLVASNPSDYGTWDERTEAIRREPDPERLNNFLAKQVTTRFREQVVKWFR
jgi:hypothetical protein